MSQPIISGADAAGRHGAEASAPVIERLAVVLGSVDLDCGCRVKLQDALARFADLERLRERRQLLADARHQVARITALLDFLKELDELGLNEADATVFDEIAQLFEDVTAAARQGAADARRLGGGAVPADQAR